MVIEHNINSEINLLKGFELLNYLWVIESIARRDGAVLHLDHGLGPRV
jgi:hypothetical protein